MIHSVMHLSHEGVAVHSTLADAEPHVSQLPSSKVCCDGRDETVTLAARGRPTAQAVSVYR